MNYTLAQLESLAMSAGFSATDAVTAAAVALAESSGNPAAVGDGGNSIGLWQIYLPAHPEFSGEDLTDPQTNANAAFSVWQAAGGSFSPWTTYGSGAYLTYVPAPSFTPAASPSGITSTSSVEAGISMIDWMWLAAAGMGILILMRLFE